jgi:ABC-2 type transporter.
MSHFVVFCLVQFLHFPRDSDWHGFLETDAVNRGLFLQGRCSFLVRLPSALPATEFLICRDASALLFSALASMAELPSLFSHRPIVVRHQTWALYHPFVEAVALTLVDLPITFLISIVFSTVLYELVQLQQSAGQFL